MPCSLGLFIFPYRVVLTQPLLNRIPEDAPNASSPRLSSILRSSPVTEGLREARKDEEELSLIPAEFKLVLERQG